VAPQLLDTMTVLVTYLKHSITVLLTCGPKSVADTYSLKKCNLAPSCMIGHCTSRVWRDMGTHWPISYKNVRSCQHIQDSLWHIVFSTSLSLTLTK